MPYIILSQPNREVPVYVVQKQNGEGKKRTLHRNLMYPIGFISERPIPVPRPRARHSISTPVTPRLKPQGDRDEDNISTISDDSRILVMESESNISTNIENNDIQEPIHEEGSASEQLDESEERDSEANEVMEDFGDDADATDEDETVPILPRRSSRVRQAPNWMSSGDFITKSNISDKMKWQEKSDFILNFLKTTSNASISPETTEFVVKHVLNF
ncbi:uncharacterized protein LOC130047641 [Ostrea edulis]|uniref:uncharacterized protein LOC130047641 n=1 Tax=Ostrea edulis TaxID=37623 RepID=UPI0024AEB505|nr:uncharacterized protein LOC130047641 [Ostrea edulis]